MAVLTDLPPTQTGSQGTGWVGSHANVNWVTKGHVTAEGCMFSKIALGQTLQRCLTCQVFKQDHFYRQF